MSVVTYYLRRGSASNVCIGSRAAGTGRDQLDGATVGEVLAAASRRYGQRFVDVLPTCRIW